VWRGADIVERVRNALRDHAAALELEQSVRGIDALDEVRIHQILVQGLEAAGLGVLRERGYPASQGRKLSERQRCDLLLTPQPGMEPEPQLSKAKRKAAGQPGLFDAPVPALQRIDARECYWLEVKVVGQYEYVQGVPGPNASWGSSLVRSVVEDVHKLSSEPGIASGGLLLVLFTSEAHVAEHDVVQALHKGLDRGLRVSSIDQSSFAIQDRAGNANCTLTLIGVWRPEDAVSM